MTPIDFGPFKISPVQRWLPETSYRILKAGSAGRPLEPIRDGETKIELRFPSYSDALKYLLDENLITLGEDLQPRLRNDGAGKYAASKAGEPK